MAFCFLPTIVRRVGACTHAFRQPEMDFRLVEQKYTAWVQAPTLQINCVDKL
ncbi:MAG: hypothetical protein Q4B82_07965 [Alysiella sp.]|uniref:hypothetical protein n=1 Tax=Alysiella sp. TaxID=1872483 RepID=UPI0026DC980A|nr:hypothetical protein [Alysiella sp.]MDO4434497.1 hypothetical protein [Alysiella sp.]